MLGIKFGDLPEQALLAKYDHADCYQTEIEGMISHVDYVRAFYTSPLFKLERLILSWVAKRPSSDEQADQLAKGERRKFAVWDEEGRAKDQLLLCDHEGLTRSWLMVESISSEVSTEASNHANTEKTRLYFGSAVTINNSADKSKKSTELIFKALAGFHHLYSILLLSAAKSQLQKLKP